MTQQTQSFDLLAATKHKQTALWLALEGFKKTLSKHMGLTTMPLVTDDVDKADFLKAGKTYPYGYFIINSFELIRDRQVNKTLGRHGASVTLDNITNATIEKGYLFPCNIEIEFHFVHDDVLDVISFIEKTAILGALDKFTFKCEMAGVEGGWVTEVKLAEGAISFPRAVREDPSNPGALDVNLNFTMNTRIGLVRSVPKINNQGVVTQSITPGNAPEEGAE